MPGLIRTEEENQQQRDCIKRIVPTLDASKVAVYDEGITAYPLTSLSNKERKAMKDAGYEYYYRCWHRVISKPKLRIVR